MSETQKFIGKCLSGVLGKQVTMTDKQIICKCNDKECGQCSFEEQLKRKEQECERLKQTLTEIKELCKPQFELFVYRLNAQQLAEQILQKISDLEV